ncbi:MAG: DUF445 family protein [Treponema sp.]|jgi:uncharacterized membrane protein YheB (UPF0754 family)|nr:DUF445 family protein [Treponema sp.]
MKNVLIWLVPPFIGAIIGYITNAVAIKMLFRPLKEVRLFGMRLPFTPGILPRQRHELADSIGRMVERDLLTPDILRQRLAREDIRQGITASIAGYTEKVLASPLASLLNQEFPAALFHDAPMFDTLMDTFMTALLEHAADRGMFNLSIRDLAGAEQMERLRNTLGRFLLRTPMDQKRLESLVPVLENAYPRITESCIRFLKKAEIHEELETQGKLFLAQVLNKLNSLQRFFISAGQYDKAIYDRMSEIIDDLIEQLDHLFKDEAIRRRLIGFSLDSAFVSAKEPDPRLVQFILDLVMTSVDKPLRDLLSTEDLLELGRNLLVLIRKNASGEASLMRRFFKKVLEKHEDLSLEVLFSIDRTRKERLDALLCGALLGLVDKELDPALETINVRTLVSERIDALDMLKVEHIVLDVMANQLKWINLFGAILGAFIGWFQSVFSWFIRGL